MTIYRNQLVSFCAASSAALLLAGCATTGPNNALPALPFEAPSQWSEQHTSQAPVLDQINVFSEPSVKALVDEALSGNLDLASAQQRLVAANATALGSKGLLLPSVNLNGSGSRSRGVSNQAGLPLTGYQTSYGLNVAVAWEADLWGRLSA